MKNSLRNFKKQDKDLYYHMSFKYVDLKVIIADLWKLKLYALKNNL